MGYLGQDEDHLESPGTPSCDSLQTSNPMQSSGAGPLQYDQIHGRIGAHQMWYDRRTASPLEPLSRRTMASKRRLFEMRIGLLRWWFGACVILIFRMFPHGRQRGVRAREARGLVSGKAPSKTLFEGKEIPAGAKIRPKEEGQEGEKCLLTICLYNNGSKHG